MDRKNAIVQIALPGAAAGRVMAAALKIPDEQLGVDGREANPHITIKFGVEEDVEKLRTTLSSVTPFSVTLGKLHVFEVSTASEGQAPVVAEVIGEQLLLLHNAIDKAVGNRPDDFEFKPHVTLAYVKPEFASQYEGSELCAGISFQVKTVELSKKDRTVEELALGQPPTEIDGVPVYASAKCIRCQKRPAEAPGEVCEQCYNELKLFVDQTYPYYFHGTSEKFLPAILKQGLASPVYLTPLFDMALTEAGYTTTGDPHDKSEPVGGRRVVIVVGWDRSLLKAELDREYTVYSENNPAIILRSPLPASKIIDSKVIPNNVDLYKGEARGIFRKYVNANEKHWQESLDSSLFLQNPKQLVQKEKHLKTSSNDRNTPNLRWSPSGYENRDMAELFEDGKSIGKVEVLFGERNQLPSGVAQTEGLEIWPEYRHKGKALDLYTAVFDSLRAQGYKEVWSSDIRTDGGEGVWLALRRHYKVSPIEDNLGRHRDMVKIALHKQDTRPGQPGKEETNLYVTQPEKQEGTYETFPLQELAPGLFEKDAAHPNVLYHSAPRELRETILKEGLRRKFFDEGGADGIFFYSTPSESDLASENFDVWRVDVQGLHIEPDTTTDVQDGEAGAPWWVDWNSETIAPARLERITKKIASTKVPPVGLGNGYWLLKVYESVDDDTWEILSDGDKLFRVGEVSLYKYPDIGGASINTIRLNEKHQNNGLGKVLVQTLSKIYGSLTSDPQRNTNDRAKAMWRGIPGVEEVPSPLSSLIPPGTFFRLQAGKPKRVPLKSQPKYIFHVAEATAVDSIQQNGMDASLSQTRWNPADGKGFYAFTEYGDAYSYALNDVGPNTDMGVNLQIWRVKPTKPVLADDTFFLDEEDYDMKGTSAVFHPGPVPASNCELIAELNPDENEFVFEHRDKTGGSEYTNTPRHGANDFPELEKSSTLADGVFYRGTEPGREERISTGENWWDDKLFVADKPEHARNYGSQIDEYHFKPGAKILVEGTKEFTRISGRSGFGGNRKGESMLDWAVRVGKAAEEAGYDAVYFKLQGTIGTVVLKPESISKVASATEYTSEQVRDHFRKMHGRVGVIDQMVAEVEEKPHMLRQVKVSDIAKTNPAVTSPENFGRGWQRVEKYKQQRLDGSAFPAVILNSSGDILDGTTRVAAAILAGDEYITAYVPVQTDKTAKGQTIGQVYLLHFNDAFKHARHYLGWAENAESRIEQHRNGTGARLTQVIKDHGISFEVARLWDGKDRNFERQLKNQGGLSRHCPLCKAQGIDRDSVRKKKLQEQTQEVPAAPETPESGPDFVEQVEYAKTSAVESTQQFINAVSLVESPAKIVVTEREGRVRIKDLISEERGKGHASKLLAEVVRLADEYGIVLELTASPYGDEETRLNHDQLKAFYQRYGFEEEEGFDIALGYLIRAPKTAPDPKIAAALPQGFRFVVRPEDQKIGWLIRIFPEGKDVWAGELSVVQPMADYGKNKERVFIFDAVVRPEFRSKGLGRALYEKAIEIAREQGFEWITSGNYTSPDARNVWKSLEKNYPVQNVKSLFDPSTYGIKLSEKVSGESFQDALHRLYPNGLPVYHETPAANVAGINAKGIEGDSVFGTIDTPSNFVNGAKGIFRFIVPPSDYPLIVRDMRYSSEEELLNTHPQLKGADISYGTADTGGVAANRLEKIAAVHTRQMAQQLIKDLSSKVPAKFKLWGSLAKKKQSDHDIDLKILPQAGFKLESLLEAMRSLGFSFTDNEWAMRAIPMDKLGFESKEHRVEVWFPIGVLDDYAERLGDFIKPNKTGQNKDSATGKANNCITGKANNRMPLTKPFLEGLAWEVRDELAPEGETTGMCQEISEAIVDKLHELGYPAAYTVYGQFLGNAQHPHTWVSIYDWEIDATQDQFANTNSFEHMEDELNDNPVYVGPHRKNAELKTAAAFDYIQFPEGWAFAVVGPPAKPWFPMLGYAPTKEEAIRRHKEKTEADWGGGEKVVLTTLKAWRKAAPKVFYHGSNFSSLEKTGLAVGFEQNNSMTHRNDRIFLTDDKDLAEGYGDHVYQVTLPNPNLLEPDPEALPGEKYGPPIKDAYQSVMYPQTIPVQFIRKLSGKTSQHKKRAFKVEVPKSVRDHFWEEPPVGHYEFWAFRHEPKILPKERIIFTFNGVPVAEVVSSYIEAPDKTECSQTGKYRNHWKVYWDPKQFKKYGASAGPLFQFLNSARAEMAKAAQRVYDEWEPEGVIGLSNGADVDNMVPGGGICDFISQEMGAKIMEGAPEGTEIVEGGQDGDDHSWLVVCNTVSKEVYGVDIPSGVYETGGGYSWKKKPGVTIQPTNVEIFKLDINLDDILEHTASKTAAVMYNGGSGPGKYVTYWTPNRAMAESYTTMHDDRYGKGTGKLNEANINIAHPAPPEVIEREATRLGIDNSHYTPATVFDENLHGAAVSNLVARLIELGFDGAILEDIAYGKQIQDKAYVVFNSGSMKHAAFTRRHPVPEAARQIGEALGKVLGIPAKYNPGWPTFTYITFQNNNRFLELGLSDDSKEADGSQYSLWLSTIEVEAPYKRKGLGGQLLDATIQLAKKMGFPELKIHHPWNREFWAAMQKKYPGYIYLGA